MNTKICPTCHAPIPAHAPGGFCPSCLLREAGDEVRPGAAAPSVVEVSAAFPQLEILGLIGQGGMGFVYRARQPGLDRDVALKILSPVLGRDPAFAERFAREARVLGKLSHPNIVAVFEHGESGGFFYLLMEFVDGVNLRQAMRAGRFSPAQALAVVPGICDALQAAHSKGVWHRDIKPENILLDAKGGVKIADFGIARIVGDPMRDFTLTATGAALGSAAYMAPEQHEKPHDVDHRADIYSLGVVLYEMLTGELPLGRFPAPSERAAVSARIDEIVLQTLEKERDLRQQSAAEVKTDVTRAASSASAKTPGSDSPLTRLSRLVLWSLCLFLGGGVLAAIGGGIMGNFPYAATGGAVLLGFGGLGLVLGAAGMLWSLFEMRRRWMQPIGRPLLIGLTLAPLAVAAAYGIGALACLSEPFPGGLPVLTGLLMAALGLVLWIVFYLGRPLSETTPLRRKLAWTATVLGCVSLFSAVIWAKRLDGHWPHSHHRLVAKLMFPNEDRPSRETLLALLPTAVQPGRIEDYELSFGEKNEWVQLACLSETQPFSWTFLVTTQKEADRSHPSAALSRLRDLLPPAQIANGRIEFSVPERINGSPTFWIERVPLSLLLGAGVLLVALAGGRRSVWIIGGAAGVSLMLSLAPQWPGNPGELAVMTGPIPTQFGPSNPPPNFKADFTTPEKAVETFFAAACWEKNEVCRKSVSKALAQELERLDGWKELLDTSRRIKIQSTSFRADPKTGWPVVEVFVRERVDQRLFHYKLFAVEEGGQWRLDSVPSVGGKVKVKQPATLLRHRDEAFDQAKKLLQEYPGKGGCIVVGAVPTPVFQPFSMGAREITLGEILGQAGLVFEKDMGPRIIVNEFDQDSDGIERDLWFEKAKMVTSSDSLIIRDLSDRDTERYWQKSRLTYYSHGVSLIYVFPKP